MDRAEFRPTPPADAHLETGGGHHTLVFVRDLRQSPEVVWSALTDPGRLAEWAPFLADRDLGSPGDATLTLIDGESAEQHPATVRRAEPPHLLEYTWGDDLLRWEVTRTATGSRLTLRHTLADGGIAPMVAAGWHLCLDVADHLLAGDPVGPIRGSEAKDFGWHELRDAYAKRLARD